MLRPPADQFQRADSIALANRQIDYNSKVELRVKDNREKATMVQLGQMGFVDFDKNLNLCKKHKNDINQIINALNA